VSPTGETLSRRQFDALRRRAGETVRSGLGASETNRELARALAKREGISQRSVAASKRFEGLTAAYAQGGRARLAAFRDLGLDIGPSGEIWYHGTHGGRDYSGGRESDAA
jgi:hypothetical protein